MATYRDRYGFLHHKRVIDGDPLTSENGPLFDGCNTAIRFHLKRFFANDAWESIKRHEMLCTPYWKVTPISDRPDFSRDNWDGLFMTLECIEVKAKQWKDKDLLNHVKFLKKRIPIFHKQRKVFFRDIPMVLAVKYRWTRYLGMTIPRQIACIVSMYQTHKHNGTQAKTDGKIMALCLCFAFRWDFTLKIINSMLKMKRHTPLPTNAWHLVPKIRKNEKLLWQWESWSNIFMDYFNDAEHPNVVLLRGHVAD